jgi:hypothetical protein
MLSKPQISYWYVILQLVLTVMLLTIIVYIYTVIAFNFFRKFYVQEEEEEVDKKCHDMLTVSFIPLLPEFFIMLGCILFLNNCIHSD